MLRKVERVTVTDTIIDQLIDVIRSGRLKPGDRVPTELELSDSLGVSRTSVREALKALQVLGLIERRQEGTVVSHDLSTRLLDRVLETSFIARQIDISHLFEARRILEGELAALAAAHADDAATAELHALCDRMEAIPEDDFETYFDLDMRFHQHISECSGNTVLERLWNVIHDLLESSRGEIAAIPDIKAQSNANHRRLLAALEHRDAAAARTIVHDSLGAVEQLFVHALEKETEGERDDAGVQRKHPERAQPRGGPANR